LINSIVKHVGAAALLSVLFPPPVVGQVANGTDGTFGVEPEVSAAESALLQEADALAEGDPQAGVAKLNAGLRPDANPALLFALGCLYVRADQLDLAGNAFAEALVHEPGFVRARMNLAGVEARRGRTDEAVALLRGILADHPTMDAARLNVAGLLLQQERFDDATAELKQLQDRGYELDRVKRMLATSAYLAEEDDDAERLLRELAGQHPDDTDLHRMLAMILLRQEKRQDAEMTLTALVARLPADVELRLALADVMIDREDYVNACEHLSVALEQAPKRHDARLAIVAVLQQLGRHGDTIPHLNLLTESDVHPKGPVWASLGAALLETGRPVAAESAFRQAVRFEPDSTEVYAGIIRSVMEQGDVQRARGMIECELRRQPESREMWRLLAHAVLDAGDREEALVVLECARRMGVIDGDGKGVLGDLLLDHGLAEEAADTYLSTVDAPVPPSRLIGAANTLVQAGEYAAAGKLLERLMAMSSLDEATRNALALARANLARGEGKPTEALRWYDELLGRNPIEREALRRSASLLREEGRLDEARERLGQLCRAHPDARAGALVELARIAVERGDHAEAAQRLEESLAIESNPHVERYLAQVKRFHK